MLSKDLRKKLGVDLGSEVVVKMEKDDSKYGISLQAEPDSDRLGKRLKADFKTVAPAVKGWFVPT